MRIGPWFWRLALLVLVVALPGCGSGSSGGGNNGGVGTIAIGITPTTATIAEGDTVSFSVKIVNTTNTTINWTVAEANGGTVTAAGVYTAPLVTGKFHVTATSQADPTKAATAVVTVVVPISVTTNAVTVYVNRTFNFNNILTAVDPVTWKVEEANGGMVTQAGVYTAPAAPGTFHLDVISQNNAAIKQTITITVLASPLTVSPTSATISVNATQVFTAMIAGAPGQTVTWTVTDALGNPVSGSGSIATNPNGSATYTAPGVPGTYYVTATGQTNNTVFSKTVPVTVQAGNVTGVIQ